MPTSKTKLNFTKTALDGLPAAAAGTRDYYNDSRMKGLQLLVTARGSKSFYLYKRIGGRPHRHFLGVYPDLTPENARKKCEGARGLVAMGQDLRANKRREKIARVTLSDAFKAFKETRSSLKESTLYGYGRIVETALASVKGQQLSALSKDKVAKLHQSLTQDRGPAQADKALRVLRAILNFAQYHYEDENGRAPFPENPVRRLSQTRAWNRVKRRSTYIKPDQLEPWFAAVLNLKAAPQLHEFVTTSDWLQLTILTGLRRNEGLALPWASVDLGNRTLTLCDTKNREDHTLPLSSYVHQLLKRRWSERVRDPITGHLPAYVFASYGKTGHLVDPREPLMQVTRESGVRFIPHDLRRTFITIAEGLDIPAYALKRLLNHKMRQDVTAGYIITDVERLRRPMQQVADFILAGAGVDGATSTQLLHAVA